jgi:hypothetical protein
MTVIEIAIGRPKENEASETVFVSDTSVAAKWLLAEAARTLESGSFKRLEGRRRFNVELTQQYLDKQLTDDSVYLEFGKQNDILFWVNLNVIDVVEAVEA